MKPSITAADSGLESIQNNVWEGCWGEGWRQGHLKQSVCVYVRRRLLITRVAAKSMKVLLLSSGSHNTMPRQWFLSSQHNRQGRTSGCGYCYMTVDATCCRWRFLMFTRIILKNSDLFSSFLSRLPRYRGSYSKQDAFPYIPWSIPSWPSWHKRLVPWSAVSQPDWLGQTVEHSGLWCFRAV